MILKKEKNYISDNNIIKIKKEQTNVVLDNDTVSESQYEFLVPKNSKSYESVVNSIPSIHIFSYPKDQYLVVLKTNQKVIKTNLIGIDRESFLSAVERIGNIFYNIENIKMSGSRKYDVGARQISLYAAFLAKLTILFHFPLL